MPGSVRPVSDERDLLVAFLDQQRDAFATIAYGLTDEQIRHSPITSSEMTLGGLLKHVGVCEREWVAKIVAAPGRPETNPGVEYGQDWQLTSDDTLESLLASIEANAGTTREAVAAADLDAFVPAPQAPWFAGIEGWSVRWVLAHLIEEQARHAGHGDLMREAIDGATLYELMAARESWPPNEYLKPWTPPST